MKVWKNNKFLLLLLALFLFASFALAQEEKTPKATVETSKAPPFLPRIVDSDKNKIFDNLEALLRDKPETEIFPVIVLFTRSVTDEDFAELKGKIGDFSLKFKYRAVSGMAASLTNGQIKKLAKEDLIKQIEEDAKVVAFMDNASYWFGVNKARTDFLLDGNLDGAPSYSAGDAVIAVIDSGIDYNHVDLDGGKVIGQKCYCCSRLNPQGCVKPCCPNGQEEDNNAMDDYGHGTHVSSIAAGEGEGNSNYKGVAPGGALVGVKVLDSEGGGYMSYVNMGIDWVITNKDTYGIEVLNISLGAPGSSDGTDSSSQLVNAAVNAGIVAVVSAGNEGPGKYTIGSPAAAAKAITVGAMADVYPGAGGSFISCGDAPGYGFYQVCFSSRGPTADERIKPDISPPGVFIQAAAMGTGNGYTEKSGTSMSSPFTAGLAALMLHANSSLTPAQIKTKIMDTSLDWGPSGDDIDYGAGRLDGYEAIKSAGGYSGANIATPEHQYFTGSLTGTGDEEWHDINIADTAYPIAVTLVMPDWASSTNPDFDLFLYDTDGTTELDSSISVTRQETVGYQPTTPGTYKLRVYSYAGSGNYFFDQSAGTAAVSISLTSDGVVEFGILALGATADTSGDVQTVRVDGGPADLEVKSSNFSDGTNAWTLSTANGANQVKWEFSKDETSWSTFSSANTLFALDTSVAQGDTRNLYLRLTMPTSTSSNNEHSATVTIVATSPL